MSEIESAMHLARLRAAWVAFADARDRIRERDRQITEMLRTAARWRWSR